MKFHGRVSDEELDKIYEETTIFVLPPRYENGDYEGFGIVYLEANARDIPVIGTDTGRIPDAILYGQSGLLIHPDSPGEIVEAIAQIYEDHVVSPDGPKRWADSHTWDEIVHKWESELERMSLQIVSIGSLVILLAARRPLF